MPCTQAILRRHILIHKIPARIQRYPGEHARLRSCHHIDRDSAKQNRTRFQVSCSHGSRKCQAPPRSAYREARTGTCAGGRVPGPAQPHVMRVTFCYSPPWAPNSAASRRLALAHAPDTWNSPCMLVAPLAAVPQAGEVRHERAACIRANRHGWQQAPAPCRRRVAAFPVCETARVRGRCWRGCGGLSDEAWARVARGYGVRNVAVLACCGGPSRLCHALWRCWRAA